MEKSSTSEDIQSPESGQSNTRRSIRRRNPSRKLLESIKSPRKSTNINISNEYSDEEDIEADEMVNLPEKPSVLTEDVDMNQKLYSFKTPKKKHGMTMLATNTPKTPRTPRTVSSLNQKTPHGIRAKIKKGILKRIQLKLLECDSSTDSEYNPSSDDDDDNETVSSGNESLDQIDEESDKECNVKSKNNRKSINIKKSHEHNKRSSKYPSRQDHFVLESDGYFAHQSTKKIITSNHTLNHLKTPRLPYEDIHKHLSSMKLSNDHEIAIREINKENRSYFDKWLFLLNEGYSILLYGLGSKRNLLEKFRIEKLPNQMAVVVNGFFPSLTMRNILESITNDILSISAIGKTIHEIVDAIDEELHTINDLHIFLIVHNLDGPMLRTSKDQLCLSRLAKIQNIHLVASIDHINTPFLWDYTKLHNYKFSWWDTTTMLPYTEETSFENSMLVQNSGNLALTSMKNVFQSLTTNSRQIFTILIKYQLVHKDESHYQGMPYKDLYLQCRQAFVVSSDMALRSQLTEFLDHNMVKMKRMADGADHLVIPMEKELLQQFLNEQQTD